MSKEKPLKNDNKKYLSLIIFLHRKFPDMAKRIENGVRNGDFTTKDILEYFHDSTVLYGIYREADNKSVEILEEYSNVIDSLCELCECEKNEYSMCDDEMEEIIFHLLDKKYNESNEGIQELLPTKSDSSKKSTSVRIDGKKTTPNEKRFYEFVQGNFDEDEWLKELKIMPL